MTVIFLNWLPICKESIILFKSCTPLCHIYLIAKCGCLNMYDKVLTFRYKVTNDTFWQECLVFNAAIHTLTVTVHVVYNSSFLTLFFVDRLCCNWKALCSMWLELYYNRTSLVCTYTSLYIFSLQLIYSLICKKKMSFLTVTKIVQINAHWL